MLRNASEVVSDVADIVYAPNGKTMVGLAFKPSVVTADRLALIERLRELAVQALEGSGTDAAQLQTVLYTVPGILRLLDLFEQEVREAEK